MDCDFNSQSRLATVSARRCSISPPYRTGRQLEEIEVRQINDILALSSRSRSIEAPIETRAKLHELALELIRSVFPPPKAIRLVGVTLSNFRSPTAGSEAELPFREI
jgi:hypothetical protein